MTAGFITVEHGISEHHSNLGAGNLGAWNHGPPNQKWERRTNVVDPSQAGSSLSLNEHRGFFTLDWFFFIFVIISQGEAAHPWEVRLLYYPH